MSLDLIRRNVKGELLTAADHDANLDVLEAAIAARVDAQAYLTEAATTTIVTQGVFVAVTGGFTIATGAENLSLNVDNELVYSGTADARILFTAAFTVNPSNNDRLAFRAGLNGATLDYSQTIIEQGSGPGSSPRAGSIIALMTLSTNDRIGLYIADLTGTGDVPWLSATYLVVSV